MTTVPRLPAPSDLALRALAEIARTGSLTRAAGELSVSLPAVSQAVNALEDQLGVRVLVRERRPVTLTHEGRVLLDYALRARAQLEAGMREVEALGRLAGGIVWIGSFGASASTHVLPKLIAAFSAAHPDVELQVHEVPDAETVRALRDGTVDVAVTVEPEGNDLDWLPLAHDQLVALVPYDHLVADRSSLDAAALVDQPFILTKGGSEPLVRRWFARSGNEPRIAHTVQQITSILALVRAGLGVSVIAELAVPNAHDGVRVVALEPPARRSIGLARLKGLERSIAAGAFWKRAWAMSEGAE